MEEISVNGETYVKSLILAKKYGYTADYLGQLCRSGDVVCTMVGRTWYVSESSLLEHKKTRYRSTAAKSKATLRQMATVEVGQPKAAAPAYVPVRNTNRYETDESDLLPLIKKLGSAQPAEALSLHEVEIVAEDKAFSNDIVEAETIVPVAIKKIHPRPRLRTIPVPSTARASAVPRISESRPPRPQRSISVAYVIALMLLTILLESALVAGSLGLEKQVVANVDGTALVLYGFDLAGVKENLGALIQKFI